MAPCCRKNLASLYDPKDFCITVLNILAAIMRNQYTAAVLRQPQHLSQNSEMNRAAKARLHLVNVEKPNSIESTRVHTNFESL